MKKIFNFVKNYKEIVFILLFIFIITIGYLLAPNNLTGMLWGDGWFHSIYVDQIFKLGYISYEDPYRMFDGLKINGVIHNYPIHYTQFYHLGLGIFNNLLGIKSPFFWGYTLIVNILLTLFIYLFLNNVLGKSKAFFITLVYLLALFSRILYINFMEGFLLLEFFVFAFLFSRYFLIKKNIFLYISIIFLAFFGITKHIGFFDSLLILFLINLYFLWRREIKKIFFINLIFFIIFIPPYYNLWDNIGTIGYGVGTLTLPNWLPFKEKLQILFSSKYQMPDNSVWYKLSYQKDKTFLQYLDAYFNYFSYFGGVRRVESIALNFTLIGLFLLGVIKAFYKRKIILIGLFFITLFEFIVLVGKQQNFNQYIHIFILGLLIFIIYGLSIFIEKIHNKKSILIFISLTIFIITYSTYFNYRGVRTYKNVGRKTLINEQLYKEIGEYIKNNNKFNDKIFLASDVEFPYWSNKRYIWLGDLMREDYNLKENFNKEKFINDFNKVVKNYNISYLIVTSQNYKQKGFYDYISPNIIEILEKNNLIILEKIIKIGNSWVKIYKIIKG